MVQADENVSIRLITMPLRSVQRGQTQSSDERLMLTKDVKQSAKKT
jgi:hypothetical protein